MFEAKKKLSPQALADSKRQAEEDLKAKQAAIADRQAAQSSVDAWNKAHPDNKKPVDKSPQVVKLHTDDAEILSHIKHNTHQPLAAPSRSVDGE